MTITDADFDAAGMWNPGWLTDKEIETLAECFAAHRLAGVIEGRRQMKGECAKVADSLGSPVFGGDGSTRYCGTSDQAAAAIRAIPLEK